MGSSKGKLGFEGAVGEVELSGDGCCRITVYRDGFFDVEASLKPKECLELGSIRPGAVVRVDVSVVATADEVRERVLEYVRSNPGSTDYGIAKALGLPMEAVEIALHWLEAEGEVRGEPEEGAALVRKWSVK